MFTTSEQTKVLSVIKHIRSEKNVPIAEINLQKLTSAMAKIKAKKRPEGGFMVNSYPILENLVHQVRQLTGAKMEDPSSSQPSSRKMLKKNKAKKTKTIAPKNPPKLQFIEDDIFAKDNSGGFRGMNQPNGYRSRVTELTERLRQSQAKNAEINKELLLPPSQRKTIRLCDIKFDKTKFC